MGHPGKHIIDPETGLCEICDHGAIQEIHQGRRPVKKVYYNDRDDAPYAKNRYVEEVVEEPQPRYVRKVVYPSPTGRPRRALHEQPTERPIIVRRKIIRHERPSPEDVIIRRPSLRPKTYYYVDREGQMVPQRNTPSPEPPRRYVVRPKEALPPPPPRTVRVVRQQIRTPPPPATEVWHPGPRRLINSDTEIVDRQQRMRRAETNYTPPLRTRPEMYHLVVSSDEKRYSPVDPPIHSSREYRTPSPRLIEQNDKNRRTSRVEPERQRTDRPPPTVVKRVYAKLPPGKHQPERRAARTIPPTKLSHENAPSPDSERKPALYYIRPTENYD